MIKALRYRLVVWLDKNDAWCWADLVAWAEGWGRSLRDCKRTCDAPCYCGKADHREDLPWTRTTTDSQNEGEATP